MCGWCVLPDKTGAKRRKDNQLWQTSCLVPMFVKIHVCMCVYLYVCVCMFVLCVYVHIVLVCVCVRVLVQVLSVVVIEPEGFKFNSWA